MLYPRPVTRVLSHLVDSLSKMWRPILKQLSDLICTHCTFPLIRFSLLVFTVMRRNGELYKLSAAQNIMHQESSSTSPPVLAGILEIDELFTETLLGFVEWLKSH